MEKERIEEEKEKKISLAKIMRWNCNLLITQCDNYTQTETDKPGEQIKHNINFKCRQNGCKFF